MFFTAIHQMMTESVDLTIVIRKTNGQLTVSTLPKSNGLKDEAQNHIVPLTVTGTPQELDTGFLQAVTRPIQKTCWLISNMAQFEAQADKAAASSKAAKEAKSRNHREAVSVLTQAKAHANAAQLKEIEEKIKAADTEMNRGSLFDLMEQEAQPEPSVQQQQPHSQQPAYTQATEQRNPQPQRPQQPAPQQAYTRRPSQPMPGQAQPASQRPQQAYTQHPQQPGIWPSQQQPPQPQARPQIQPHAQYVQRTGGQQPSQTQYPPQPEIQDWQEERFMQEDEQQPYLSDQEHPAYSEKDYEEYIDFPQSMLEPKYSPYQTV